MARASNGESVLHRHLRILEAFRPQAPELTLSEIAGAADLPVSSTHRLMTELLAEGLLERVGERRYRLGIRLWEFASRTPGGLGLRELARPWIDAVQVRIRQHTQLGVLQGHEVVFVERQSAPDAVINATVIGGRLPVALSSSGHVFLAHGDPGLLAAVIEEGWPRVTPDSPADGAVLTAAVRRTHSRGFSVCEGYLHVDSTGIAVPVFGVDGRPAATLAVVVGREDSRVQYIVELLMGAAQGISRALTASEVQPLLSTSRASLEYFASLEG